MKNKSLIEGRNRIVVTIQTLFRYFSGKHLKREKANQLFKHIFDIIFDEVLLYGKFVLPSNYGTLYIHKRRRKIHKDREYKRLVANDETGEYNITYLIRFRPGVRIQQRLKRYGVEPQVATSKDDNILDVLTYFEEED